jgi:hypothetical protein
MKLLIKQFYTVTCYFLSVRSIYSHHFITRHLQALPFHDTKFITRNKTSSIDGKTNNSELNGGMMFSNLIFS